MITRLKISIAVMSVAVVVVLVLYLTGAPVDSTIRPGPPAWLSADPSLPFLQGLQSTDQMKRVLARAAIEDTLSRHPDARRTFTRKELDWLEAATSSTDPLVRNGAINLLSAAGAGGARAIPCLIAATKDPDHDVRRVAGEALARLAPSDERVVQALTRLGSDPVDQVRRQLAPAVARAVGRGAHRLETLLATLRREYPPVPGSHGSAPASPGLARPPGK
ncbi:MAG: HEAT repeat domain-containing protein [Candidatus Riflebacteria bacterium]|nr:HEAT repeat domain-containing protein [Candidatus Riflebacteria bacterium]